MWKRRRITALCFQSLLRAYCNAPEGFEFVTVIVASNEPDAALAASYGFDVMRFENKPLGRKFNAGLSYALERYNFDYLFQLNSDNLLSTDFWQLFSDYFDKRMPFFGIDKLYFYDAFSGDMREFQYTLGCGIRFIHRTVVEQAGIVENEQEETFELWPDHINSGLDNASANIIAQRTRRMQYIARSEAVRLPVVVDIKSSINIHPFAEFRLAKRVAPLHRVQAMRRFPELRKLDEATDHQKNAYAFHT